MPILLSSFPQLLISSLVSFLLMVYFSTKTKEKTSQTLWKQLSKVRTSLKIIQIHIKMMNQKSLLLLTSLVELPEDGVFLY